jgi:hypothetical protein
MTGDSARPLYLVATDDGSEMYAENRRVGLELALKDEARVVLFDRSSESYLVDPYPVGAWSSSADAVSAASQLNAMTLRSLGRAYLAEQLAAAREAGLDASAYLAMGHGAHALAEAVERWSPDLLVLPAAMARPTLLDRLRRNTLDDLRERTHVEVHLVQRPGTDGAAG